MFRLVRDCDWAGSTLGAVATWPRSLKLAVELVLESPIAMILMWGPDLVQIYNDGYRVLIGAKHPSGLGRPTHECWPEVRSFTEPVYAAVLRGESRSFRSQRLALDRGRALEAGWFDLTYMPLRDEGGRVAGILATVVEVTDDVLEEGRQSFRVELEARLRPLRDAVEIMAAASEALGRHLGAGLVAYLDIDAAGETAVIECDWNDGSMPSIAGRHHLPEFGGALVAELKTGRTLAIEDVADDPRVASPASVWAFERLSVRALLDVPLLKDGRLYAVFSVLDRMPRAWTEAEVDLTRETAERTWAAVERARAEARLRESEALLHGIFQSAPIGLGVWDVDLRFVRVNQRLAEMNGVAPEDHVGRHPTELLPALHDLDPLLQAWRRVLATGEPLVGVEISGATPADPDVVGHWTEHFFPIRVGDAIVGLGGIVEDSSERRRAEEHRALLVGELNHRVKNTLAIVQAIARQTFRRADIPDDVREAFDGRLSALAAAHDLLTASEWQSATLHDIVRDVIGLCGMAEARAGVRGPRVVLEPREAVSVALALHELCTNAMKYGAMSLEGGMVDVTWQLVDGIPPRFELVWRETGGPPILPPDRTGFGTRMIEQVLAQELGGSVHLDFRPEGLVCTITAPWPQDRS